MYCMINRDVERAESMQSQEVFGSAHMASHWKLSCPCFGMYYRCYRYFRGHSSQW
jgi:hypothetical protein